jgi:hypothetical protein
MHGTMNMKFIGFVFLNIILALSWTKAEIFARVTQKLFISNKNLC